MGDSMQESHFTYEQEIDMIGEVCAETGCSFEFLAAKSLGNRHKPQFTDAQKVEIINHLCVEFNLYQEAINIYHFDTLFGNNPPPGNKELILRTSRDGIFSCVPICSNIEYLIKYFGGTYFVWIYHTKYV